MHESEPETADQKCFGCGAPVIKPTAQAYIHCVAVAPSSSQYFGVAYIAWMGLLAALTSCPTARSGFVMVGESQIRSPGAQIP